MKNAGKIRDVYADDMENEINKISELIDDFNYISMVSIHIYLRTLNSQELFIKKILLKTNLIIKLSKGMLRA
jgi:hypothetical protein